MTLKYSEINNKKNNKLRKTKRKINNKLRKTKRKRNNKIKGSGDFINPSSNADCYAPINDSNFKFNYNEKVKIEDLKHIIVHFDQFRNKGSHNELFNAQGKGICENDVDNIITIRLSKNGFNVNDKNYIKEIEDHKSEMHLQAKLIGIMPNLYMCGTLQKPDKKFYTFSIMKSYQDTVLNVILYMNTEPSEKNNFIIILKKCLYLYKQIANMNLCNIDVKPNNFVYNNDLFLYDKDFIDVNDENDINDIIEKDVIVENNDNIAIIDMEEQYNINIESIENIKEMYYMIMAYIFLNITKNLKIPDSKDINSEKRKPLENYLILLIDELLKKEIYKNPLYEQFVNVVKNNEKIQERFHNYRIENPE